VLLRYGEFLGHEINRVSVPGFIVTFRRSGSDQRDRRSHSHSTPNLLLPLDAGYWSEADGYDESLPSQLVYTPAGAEHRDSMMRLGGRYLAISVDSSIVQGTLRRWRIPIALDRPSAIRTAHVLTARNLSGQLRAPFVEEACLGIVAQLGLQICDAGGRRPCWLRRVIEICHGGGSEWPSIAAISALVGVHPVHVTRVFRRFFGSPLSQYIVAAKVQQAAAALRTGKQSVAAIAAEAGFWDQSHLCRAFKAAIGITPREYRALFH
jgi:AraC family transcriptional regulator